MSQLRYRFYILFSILIVTLMGCSESNSGFSQSISSLNITNDSQYNIFINDSLIGSSNVTVTTGIYKSFNGITHSQCTEIKETVILDNQTATSEFYTKKISSGYMYLSDDIPSLETPYIEFPIQYGSRLFGPFSPISTENIHLNVQGYHTTFTNKNGHTFNNVMEAQGNNGLIRVFFNETDLIIQKEDYRYQATIESLIK